MEKGTKRGTNSSPEPTQARAPTLRPGAGPSFLGRCTPAVTAHRRPGFGCSRCGWLELAWKVVDWWVAWGRSTGGQQGATEPESPLDFGSSQTKGSLGTQALDPTAVTQHAEGHFISFSAFFS